VTSTSEPVLARDSRAVLWMADALIDASLRESRRN
jgi:hypothetical protein